MDSLFDAIQTIEDSEGFSADAWQYLIDKGHAWKLQGYYGRTALDLMKKGICKPAPERQTDYWGNLVPSRNDGYFDSTGTWVWTDNAVELEEE
jgi:hypothetical protein